MSIGRGGERRGSKCAATKLTKIATSIVSTCYVKHIFLPPALRRRGRDQPFCAAGPVAGGRRLPASPILSAAVRLGGHGLRLSSPAPAATGAAEEPCS